MPSPSSETPTDPTSPAPAPLPPASSSPIRAVLLDADGVLQLIGTPWSVALEQGGGPGFAKELLAREEAALSGRESLSSLLTRLRRRLRVSKSTEELLAMWWRAAPDPAAWAVVRELREAGYLTVLATNQQWERRAWMSERLGYDGLCDVDAYSCDLRVAKPAPEYFRRVLYRIGIPVAEAASALFVDDNAKNIAAARDLGISTIHHPVDAGGAVLRAELVEALS
ncbi:HAD-IA family hydrolase [Actinomyces trachealis]|uniref:HAD-IA family hydrolase n=1 Tax=Actinomyces trachealis TaxID=2763540 RepID=UPI001892BE2F|nr:HAD-IA family hydrolase [Actinomyces trachealis]